MQAEPRSDAARMPVLLALAFYVYCLTALPIFSAPYVAAEFGLADAEITLLTGFVSLGALGAFVLTRRADLGGRRRTILLCFGLLPLACALTAGAPGALLFVLAQMVAMALYSTLRAVLIVFIAEEVEDEGRARGQAWFGLVGSLGGGVPLLVVALAVELPGGWRWAFALAALPLLALSFVRGRVRETARFRRSQAGRAVLLGDEGGLFQSAYRGRAIGLLVAATLRPVSLIAIGVWSYYHAVQNLALDPWLVTLLYVVGGVMGILGIPIGARLANGWGRRPTLLLGVSVAVGAGITYFWMPADRGLWTFVLLASAFGVFNFGAQAQGVAERCIETELFPTHLRATYAGWRSLAEAVARIVSQFSLAGLVHGLGDFSLAVTVLCLATLLPSLVIFLALVPETRGHGLEADSLR